MAKIYCFTKPAKIHVLVFSVLASLFPIGLLPGDLSANVTGVISFNNSLWNDIELHYPPGSDSCYVEVADSGIYFYKIEAKEFTQSKRMVILK